MEGGLGTGGCGRWLVIRSLENVDLIVKNACRYANPFTSETVSL